MVAGNYLAAYPEPTVQEIWKALAVNEAFQRVLDDPAAAEALQHPALEPLLDKPLPEPAGAAGPVGAAPAPASAVEPDGTPSTPHTGVRGRREEWTFDFRFTQPTSGSGDQTGTCTALGAAISFRVVDEQPSEAPGLRIFAGLHAAPGRCRGRAPQRT